MRDPRKEDRLHRLHARLERTERQLARLQRVEGRFPWLRLGVVIAGVLAAVVGLQLFRPLIGWTITGLALAAFVLVIMRHQRIIDIIERCTALHNMVAAQIARAELDWEHIPGTPPFPAQPEHPFAYDLNLPLLHRLMDTSASLGGSLRLAGWLSEPRPDLPAIIHRQALVRELLGRPAFRTRLLVDGALVNRKPGERWDGEQALHWLDQRTPAAALLPFLLAAGLLALVNIILFVLNILGQAPAWWVFTFGGYLVLQSLKYRESSEVFNEAYSLARHLERLRVILVDLERSPYPPDSLLGKLCRPFTTGPQKPSTALRKVSRIVTAASLRNNPFLALLLNMLGPWDLFFAYQLERYKGELRGALPGWLEAWAELEALTSMAGFADLKPETVFPELEQPSTATGNPILQAAAIGHPLIPDTQRVTNDFHMDQLGEVIIITGSNMSGKSTFLRTIGTNLALAYAGATVQADQLTAIPMRVFTSMTLADSLSDGISFFYAEVRRLKALLDQLESGDSLPLFFLVDEIFRGTNNRERQLGSRAYTQALAGKHGAGLISTHDLELVHLAETIPLVRNLHFREDIHDGQMIFDYLIRPGSSPTTNALRIMALAGLPIPPEDMGKPSHITGA